MTGYLSKPPPGVQLDRNHPLSQGLIGCWLFDEGSGLTVNDHANINFGTLTAFEPFSATGKWTGGNFGTTLQFDGVANYVDLLNPFVLTILTPFTLESWIYPRSTANAKTIVRKGLTTTVNYAIDLRGTNNLQLACFYSNGGGVTQIITGSQVALNAWSQAVGVWDGKFLNVYINGVSAATPVPTTGTPVVSTENANIGRRSDNTTFFAGNISTARIWNRALNAIEIQNLYSQPFSMFKV